MTITRRPASRTGTRRDPTRSSGGPVTRLFAISGAVLMTWQVSTFIRWIARGHVESITRFRDETAPSWIGARTFEVVFLALTIGVITYVVRNARRERRFTLDAMIAVGLLTSAWLDPAFMFYKQIFLYSSQLTNVRAWCGDMPGVLNVQCGNTPEPLVVPLRYVDALLAALLAICCLANSRGSSGQPIHSPVY